MAKKNRGKLHPRSRSKSRAAAVSPGKSVKLLKPQDSPNVVDFSRPAVEDGSPPPEIDDLASELWSDPHERLQRIRSTLELQDFRAGFWTAILPVNVAQAGTSEWAQQELQQLAELLEELESRNDRGRSIVAKSIPKLRATIDDEFLRYRASHLVLTDSYGDFFRAVYQWCGQSANANWFMLGVEIGIVALLSQLVVEGAQIPSAAGVSGATGTDGNFQAGDTVVVTAIWPEVTQQKPYEQIGPITVDFSDFGGPAAAEATRNEGVWTARYQIASGWVSTPQEIVTVTGRDNAGKSKTKQIHQRINIGPVELKRHLLRPRRLPRHSASPSSGQDSGKKPPVQAHGHSIRPDPTNAVTLAYIVRISALVGAADKILNPRRRLLPCLWILSKSCHSSELTHIRRLGEAVGRADFLAEDGRLGAARLALDYAKDLATIIVVQLSRLYIAEALLSDDDLEATPDDADQYMISVYTGLIFDGKKSTVTDPSNASEPITLSKLEFHLFKPLDDAAGQWVSRSRLREHLNKAGFQTSQKDIGNKIKVLRSKITSLPVIIDSDQGPGYRLLKKD